MKFSIVALTVLGASTNVLAQEAGEECWNAIPITCPLPDTNGDIFPNNYLGDATGAIVASYARTCDPDGTDEGNHKGVWYKLSTGSDTFRVVLDTCKDRPRNTGTYISIYSGVCTQWDQNLKCVLGDQYDKGCGRKAYVGPQSANGDTDYWIHVQGVLNSPFAPLAGFDMDVICDPSLDEVKIQDFGGPLGNIDPWYIQRSNQPPPEVTNQEDIDPLIGGTWLEIHSDRVNEAVDLADPVPRLKAHLYRLKEGEDPQTRCKEGDRIDTPDWGFENIPCYPNVDPDCPALMNGPDSVAVKQTFTIDDPYNPIKDIWNSASEQFEFCVHTFFELDFDTTDGDIEEVSYFDTFYVVKVNYNTGFVVDVAALARNPGNIGTLFNDWLVTPYLCADENDPVLDLNADLGDAPTEDSLALHDYFVGENFRICVTPDPGFENFKVEKFIEVTCSDRLLIADNTLAPGQDLLTWVDLTDRPSTENTNSGNGLAFESTVTSDMIAANSRFKLFQCSGRVKMTSSRRRILQDGGDEALALLPEDEDVTGSFKVTLRIVTPEPDGLSTGALVGISMAAFAVFLVALLILYRRGCFDKKTSSKHPKTVSVPEEDSETSGENAA